MSIQVKQLKKSYGNVGVLHGIDFEIQKGEFCVLLGPSGSGKSTLLNILGGIDTFDEGQIVIDQTTRSQMSEKELTQYRRKHLGYISNNII